MKYDLNGSMPDSLWKKIKGMTKPELEDALRILTKGVMGEERERCAKFCDERAAKEDDPARCETASVLAAKIRAQ